MNPIIDGVFYGFYNNDNDDDVSSITLLKDLHEPKFETQILKIYFPVTFTCWESTIEAN